MLAYLHWNLDPSIVVLGPWNIFGWEFGPIDLRWYGLCFAAGFLIGYSIMQRIYRREGKPEKDLDSLCVALVLGTIVGARLYHCFVYDWDQYKGDLLSILMVWKGGLASHGGVIGNLVALWLYSRKRKDQPYLWLLDRVVIPTALTGALIRLGNLFNSEIVGKPSDLPWAIVFEKDSFHSKVPRHPTQLYECLWYLIVFVIMIVLYRRHRERTPHGYLVGWFLVLVFGARFLVEFLKEPQVTRMADATLNLGQWSSIPAVLFGVWLVRSSRKRVPQAP